MKFKKIITAAGLDHIAEIFINKFSLKER